MSGSLKWILYFFSLVAIVFLVKEIIIFVYKFVNKKIDKNLFFKPTAKPLFIEKIEKNHNYSLEFFLIDLSNIVQLDPITLLASILVFPAISSIAFIQMVVILHFIIWYSSILLKSIIFKKNIQLNIKNLNILDSFDFSWKKILFISFIEYPKIQAFLIIYNFLNKILKEKQIDIILNRIIISRLSGVSINIVIKVYWFYKVFKISFSNLNLNKKKIYLPLILLEEFRQRYSLLINYSLNPLYSFVKNLNIDFGGPKILNPFYTEILDFSKKSHMLNIFKNIFKDHYKELANQLSLEPENILELSIWLNIQNSVFNNKKHLTTLFLSNPQKLEEIKTENKIIISNVFTHSKTLKTNESQMVSGKSIIQHINPKTGETLPQTPTFTYISAVESKILTDFKSIRILQDYGIKSYEDAVLFRFIEDIRAIEEYDFIMERNEILWQGEKFYEKKIMSFLNLVNKNKLHKNCENYLFEKREEFRELIERTINNEISNYISKLENLNKEWTKYPLYQDKIKIAEEIKNYKSIISNIEKNKQSIIKELLKNFIKQIENQSIQTTLLIAQEALEETGLSGLGANLIILDLDEK